MESNTRKSALRLIEKRSNTLYPDLFDYTLLSADDKPPTDNTELLRLGSITLKVIFDRFSLIID